MESVGNMKKLSIGIQVLKRLGMIVFTITDIGGVSKNEAR